MMMETELDIFKNWNSFLIYGFSFSEKSLLKTTSRQMLSKEFQYLILHFTVIIGNMLKTEIMVLWHFHYSIIRFPLQFQNLLGIWISVQRCAEKIDFYFEYQKSWKPWKSIMMLNFSSEVSSDIHGHRR